MEDRKKSFYYRVTWDEASYLKQTLEKMEIPHAIESPSPDSKLPLAEGQLAIVFPDLPVRAYHFVRELFTGDGERYPF
ncbi:hypothetical protein [Brevibacillus fulvus]|uniref:DUF2007 domain-containing protein n=1 Tax=Brevibacillus fulvus TaxID=1125967 RepID=A0A939BVS3_9BACL|nr:hypothetical protein [Brevibacillus fulvus]MBM7591739.1 hypothetical protein [Brevibacillus fulvus]